MTVQLCRLMSTSAPRDCQASSSAPAEQRPPAPSSAGLVGAREGPPAPPASSPCWAHGPAAVPDLCPARSPCRGKGTKGGDARSAGQGPRLPALPPRRGTPPPAPAAPRTALAREGTRASHAPANTGRRRAPPSPPHGCAPRHGPAPGSLPMARRSPAASPGSSRSSPAPQSDRAGLSSLPTPLTGPRPVIPSHPLTAARPVLAPCPHGSAPGSARSALSPLSPPRAPARCGSPGPALPAQPGAGDTEPQRRRSPPFESTTRWRRPTGRSPVLAVIATAPSKTRPAAACGNPKPSSALRKLSENADRSKQPPLRCRAAPPLSVRGRAEAVRARWAHVTSSSAPPPRGLRRLIGSPRARGALGQWARAAGAARPARSRLAGWGDREPDRDRAHASAPPPAPGPLGEFVLRRCAAPG